MDFNDYDTEGYYDELFEAQARPRPGTSILIDRLESLPSGDILRRQKAAEAALFNMGVTFTVYSDETGIEKIFPFDIVPRIVEPGDWKQIEDGLKQRIYALNLFIDDVYHDQKIIKDGIIPEEILYSGKCFQEQCRGINPPKGIWCHITGTDLVRDKDGKFYVLEDNLRTPSGVSYVLENRQVLKRTFPLVFEASKVRPVDDYPERLLSTLQHLTPDNTSQPTVALLTPGIYNSAYFEHSFLAQQMGIELVEGSDLVVSDGYVFMRTTKGFQKVDVIYRRIDDTFLDPTAFNPDSLLGVPGIIDVYKAGRVALANAPGTGIADDKVIYAYVPKIIKYYTGEDAILPNVPTYVCWDEKEKEHVLGNLDKYVVKAANESGGYGMLVGPHAGPKEREEFAEKIKANPRNYIAQPTVSLSRVPVIVDDHFEGRHVDLRPYVLYGEDIYVMPGGLTRVALRKGSLVVNSSQGGGSKDTWVLETVPGN
ncbi:MAG: circularly permuted type 2 ATP-grasp protein [Deltaproteobacteria bacterium]